MTDDEDVTGPMVPYGELLGELPKESKISVVSMKHVESAPEALPDVLQDNDSTSSEELEDVKLPNEPEKLGTDSERLQSRPRSQISMGRRASTVSGVSSFSKPSLFSIPDSDTPIAYTFDIVAFGDTALQLIEEVADDQTASVVHVQTPEGYAQLKLTPVAGFCVDIPDDVFNRIVTTAFVFVLKVESLPDEWERSVLEVRRRQFEVKARVRMSHNSRRGGWTSEQVDTVWMPIMVCLFVTKLAAADIDTDALKTAQTWASDNGLEVLLDGVPVILAKGPLQEALSELANDRLACNPRLSQDVFTVRGRSLIHSIIRSCRRCCELKTKR